MAENIIPQPEETLDWLEEMSSLLSVELLKLQGVNSPEDKEVFNKLMRKYDDK